MPNPAAVLGRLRARAQLEAAYRIVLDRRPDQGGVDHFADHLARRAMRLPDVVTEMIGSHEFRRTHPGLLADDPSTTVVSTDHFRIHVHAADHAIGYALALEADYEPEVTAELRALLRPGATFVDVGANYGWHALTAASIVGDEGRVLAIEPNPDNAALLARSAADSGFTNVTVVVAAVADRAGWAALVTDGSNGYIAPLEGAPPHAMACSYAVPMRTLDDIVADAGIDTADVIKIDVEGNEPAVLRGGEATFGSRPVVVAEFFPRLLADHGGSSPEALLADLRRLGYELSVVGMPGARSDKAILAAVGDRDHIDLVGRPT